jgi:hypothetical protein
VIDRVFAETTPGAQGVAVVLNDGTRLSDSVVWADGGGPAVFLGASGSATVEM